MWVASAKRQVVDRFLLFNLSGSHAVKEPIVNLYTQGERKSYSDNDVLNSIS